MENVGQYITKYRKGKVPKQLFENQEEGLLPYLSPDYLRRKSKPEFYAEPTEKVVEVEDGEVIVLWDGSNAGEIFISRKGILGSTMVKLEFNEDEIFKPYFSFSFEYLEYVLKAKTAGSGIPHADKGVIKKLDFFKPQKPEQTAIAIILSKVNANIEATKNSIKAAEKLKKSLMQNLLTGKLKPDGTLRTENEFYEDEKFGKVPLDWEVKPVGDKSICNINPNYSFIKGTEYDFLPMDAINDEFRGVSYIDKKKIDGGGYTRFKLGDILFAKITPCTENGKVALIEKMNTNVGFASTEFIVFEPKENIDNLFYYYLLTSDRVHNLSVSLMEGTTGRQRVPWKVFKNRIFAAFPTDIKVQKDISDKIKSIETSNLSKQAKINKLQRLKKSLMQNLLTGKVRLPSAFIAQFENELEETNKKQVAQ